MLFRLFPRRNFEASHVIITVIVLLLRQLGSGLCEFRRLCIQNFELLLVLNVSMLVKLPYVFLRM